MYKIWCKQFITHIILVATEGLWHLGSLLIMTNIIHNEGDLQIYFGVIFLETRNHALADITSGTFILCALSLATRKTQMAVEFG